MAGLGGTANSDPNACAVSISSRRVMLRASLFMLVKNGVNT
jgi:hypothetical protein